MKKAIILTLPLENNYGGLLQAYALQRVVSEMGYDVVTDKKACKIRTWKYRLYTTCSPVLFALYKMIGIEKLSPKLKRERDQHLLRFIDENIKTTDFFKEKLSPPKKEIKKYDIFIVGSDQVWRKEYVWVQSYLLDFLKDRVDKRRVAYSGSFGVESIDEWTEFDRSAGKRMFPRFDAISVREECGQSILENEFEVKSTLVLDPTMLLTKDDYQKLDGIETVPSKEKLLYCYILDLNDDKKLLIEKIRKEIGAEQVKYILPKKEVSPKDKESFVLPSVGEWLACFRDAAFVVTDSFHGTVFSILFNKQFVCYANKSRGISRMNTLLSTFNLIDRMVFSSEEYSGSGEIDYVDVQKTLEEKRKESLGFLSKNLS